MDLQDVEAVLGDLVGQDGIGQIVEVVREGDLLAARIVEAQDGVEVARHGVAEVGVELAAEEGADELLALFEAERVAVDLAGPDLSVEVDRERMRLEVRRQVEDVRQGDVLVARREDEERLADVRLLRDVERMGGAHARVVVEEDVAPPRLRVRIHLHVEDEQLVERGRILRVALGRVEVARDDLQLQVVEGVEEEPPGAFLPVSLLDRRLRRQLAVALVGRQLVLQEVVEPGTHEGALRPARRAGEAGNGDDARDLHAAAAHPGALHAPDGVAAHDDARRRTGLDAGGMVVARLGDGRGEGGGEGGRRGDKTVRARHRFPSGVRIRTWWRGS